MKIAIIGCGNMGSAMINAWLDKDVFKPADILVYEKHPEKLKAISSKLKTEKGDYSKIKNYDVILLAVKPKDILEVAKNIKPHISSKTIVISIAAGITIKRIASVLPKAKIVRAMPNMPAQIGMGVVGWSANKFVTTKEKEIVQTILKATGYAVCLSDESKINAVSAISGSGPAYVFYFMEALFEAGRKIGLIEKEVIPLVLCTFTGASAMASLSDFSPKELRNQVACKGGTTEEAIKIFDRKKIKQIIFEGVRAALKKSEKLNK